MPWLHTFSQAAPESGVPYMKQRNSSALQMALKMGPQGFHLADTLHPGQGFSPRGIPQPPAGLAASPTATHSKALTTRTQWFSVQNFCTPLPTQGVGGRAGVAGADSPTESNTGHRASGITHTHPGLTLPVCSRCSHA